MLPEMCAASRQGSVDVQTAQATDSHADRCGDSWHVYGLATAISEAPGLYISHNDLMAWFLINHSRPAFDTTSKRLGPICRGTCLFAEAGDTLGRCLSSIVDGVLPGGSHVRMTAVGWGMARRAGNRSRTQTHEQRTTHAVPQRTQISTPFLGDPQAAGAGKQDL